jgi:hypothetical protein
MRKISLTFGLIAGAVMSAMLVLTIPFQDQLKGNAGMAVGYASMTAAALLIYFGIRQYRDTVRDGQLPFWDGMKAGLTISAIAIVCYVVTWEIIYYTVFPDFADRFAAEAIARAKESGLTGEALAKKTAEMAKYAEMYKNPLVNIALTILEPLPVMLLGSGISAWVLRQRAENAGH